jgi:general secretion pathway protein K
MVRRDQQGLALITALFVVSLATIMAVSMMSRQQFDIRRSENVFVNEQALLYHIAVEDHATSMLQQYWKELEFLTLERYTQASALIGMGYTEAIEGGSLEVSFDLTPQARFNVNQLIDKNGKANTDALTQFKRLLQILQLDADLADILLDWLDIDQDIHFPGGAEDGYYLGLQPPYRTSNQPMVSMSELRLLNGFTDEVLKILEPFVTVLPHDMAMNINWADSKLLMSLHADIDEVIAEGIIASRENAAFKSSNDFTTIQGMQGLNIPASLYSLSSHVFKLQTTINIGRISKRFSSLINYNGSGRAVLLLRQQERLI